MKDMAHFTLPLLILLLKNVVAFPFGPSSTSCETLAPGHPGSMQTSQSPYIIETSNLTFYDNTNLTVILRANISDDWYQGFFLQARCLSCANTTLPRGTFFLADDQPAKVFKCYGLSGSVSHNSRTRKNETLVTWMPPPNFNHRVMMIATVVKTTSVWWEQVTSDVLIRADDPTTTSTFTTTATITTHIQTTTATTTTPSTQTTTTTTIIAKSTSTSTSSTTSTTGSSTAPNNMFSSFNNKNRNNMNGDSNGGTVVCLGSYLMYLVVLLAIKCSVVLIL